VSNRTPAWHTLSKAIFRADENVTTSEMLQRAGLSNWNVRKEPVIYPQGIKPLSNEYMVLRDTPSGTESLAIVGEKYHTYQNEDLLNFGDFLLDGGAKWESAGFFRQGRTIYGALTIDNPVVIDPQGANDRTNTYLLVTTSHDGSSSIRACVTPVRVFCQNTLSLAWRKATQQWSVRHTAGTDGRVQEAREALKLTQTYMDEFSIMAQGLYEASITTQQFDQMFELVYPKPADEAKASLTRWNEKFDLTRGLYLNGATNANITGTKWGALNAMTERIDWYRDGGKGQTEGLAVAASGLETGVQQEKSRILEVVSSF
jgi:phage/plasmid-like protein (TIGR03299 family)